MMMMMMIVIVDQMFLICCTKIWKRKSTMKKKSHIDERFERHRYIMLKNSNERTRIYVEQEKKKR